MNVAVRDFIDLGDGVTFHVRVIPIRSPADSTIVGMASNTLEVVYGSLPPQDPLQIHGTIETGAARLRLARFEYQPYRETYPWPPGCWEGDEPPDDRSIFEKAIDTLATVWNAISAAYDEAKSAVVSAIGAITFGLIPPEHLELALTTALIAAGIPPDIPNLDELMEQGAGYLAAAVAEQVVGPAAGEITAQLAAEYTNHPVGQPLTEEVKRRVTEEIEERSKKAILDGARAAREAALKDADKRRCGWKVTMPALTLTFRNDGPEDYRRVAVRVADYNAVFQPTGFELFIDRGETLTVPLPLLPQVRELVRSQLVDRDKIANKQLWWSEIYPTWRSRFSVTTLSQRMCSPGAPCTETWRELYHSPDRVWNTPFAQEL